MYWFFNCNNYNANAIKALVYSAHLYNPHFKPICIWDDSPKNGEGYWKNNVGLKDWLEDRGVLVHQYQSELAKKIAVLRDKEFFTYEHLGSPAPFSHTDVALSGMWSKADVPLICQELGIEDKFVLITDPDCIFMHEYDLELDWPNAYAAVAAGPEEEPYREWISGGIYVFNVPRLLEDREEFESWVIKNYRKYGYLENISLMKFYDYQHIVHIPPDWNYKPYWEMEKDYLISPTDRAIFKAVPKLLHFQGIYKPWEKALWIESSVSENTLMKYYCELWHSFVKLSEASFKFKS